MPVFYASRIHVEESNGQDIRAIVVGNKVVAAMKRMGKLVTSGQIFIEEEQEKWQNYQ